MAAFLETLEQMLVLFLVLLVGCIARRCHITDDSFDARLSSVVINISLPAFIISSVLGNDALPERSVIAMTFLYALVAYLIMIALAELVCRLLPGALSRAARGTFRFGAVFGNIGFMGFPVMQALFGSEAVLYASIFNVPFNVLIFTYGLHAVRSSGEEPQQRQDGDVPENRALALAKSLCTPSMIASLIAVVLALLRVTDADGVIGTAFSTLGQLTTPASMLVLGSTLAKSSARDMLGHAMPYVTSLVRLVIAPLAVFAVLSQLIVDDVLLGVIVLSAGMPVASMGTMFSLLYGGDSSSMSRTTFVSTALSLITIPLLSLLVM